MGKSLDDPQKQSYKWGISMDFPFLLPSLFPSQKLDLHCLWQSKAHGTVQKAEPRQVAELRQIFERGMNDGCFKLRNSTGKCTEGLARESQIV